MFGINLKKRLQTQRLTLGDDDATKAGNEDSKDPKEEENCFINMLFTQLPLLYIQYIRVKPI